MSRALKEHANSAAAISLIALCACIACFIPPLNERIVDSPLLIVLVSLGIACSAILHLIFVGVLARAYGRSPAKIIALALLTLPVGSIVGLVLLEWNEHLNRSREPGAA